MAECTDGRIHVLAESPSGEIVTLGNISLVLAAADPDTADRLIACIRQGCGHHADPNMKEVGRDAASQGQAL